MAIAKPFSNNSRSYAGLGVSFRIDYQISSKTLIEYQLNEFSDFIDGEMAGIGVRLIWIRPVIQLTDVALQNG